MLNCRKANIESTDKDGCTPLIVAAGWGQLAAVQILLDAGFLSPSCESRDVHICHVLFLCFT